MVSVIGWMGDVRVAIEEERTKRGGFGRDYCKPRDMCWYKSDGPALPDRVMFVVRNRLRAQYRNALLARHYVQSAHTRPAPPPSVTPVEKILLGTIKVCTTFYMYVELPFSNGIGKWAHILRDIYATLPLSPDRGLLYEP